MTKKVCSSKAPKESQETPEKCLKKGIGVGMNLPVKVTMDWTKDMLRTLATKLRVKNYSHMKKEELFDEIQKKGVKKYNLRNLI